MNNEDVLQTEEMTKRKRLSFSLQVPFHLERKEGSGDGFHMNGHGAGPIQSFSNL